MIFCTNCGKKLDEGLSFCGYCGNAVDASSKPVTPGSLKSTPTKLPVKKIAILSMVVLFLVGGTIGIFSFVGQQQAAEEARIKAENERAAFQEKQIETANFLREVVNKCAKGRYGFDVDYNYLFIDNEGSDDVNGASYEELMCALETLEMPKADINRTTRTRALDGTQEAEWEGSDGDFTLSATWTYHPDDGLDVNIKLKSQYLEGYDPDVDRESN